MTQMKTDYMWHQVVKFGQPEDPLNKRNNVFPQMSPKKEKIRINDFVLYLT